MQTIGKQAIMIELLQTKLKEMERATPESNGSGTTAERAAWAQATATPKTPEVR